MYNKIQVTGDKVAWKSSLDIYNETNLHASKLEGGGPNNNKHVKTLFFKSIW